MKRTTCMLRMKDDIGSHENLIVTTNLPVEEAIRHYIGKTMNVEGSEMVCYDAEAISEQEHRNALVKVTTDFGKHCLYEIRGLKEGTVLTGWYNPVNKAFDFVFNGNDAMLWVGHNCELIEDLTTKE